MIVERWTHTVKVGGRKSELVDALKDWLKLNGLTGRVYTYRYAWDKVCIDVEFETEKDLRKQWDNYDPRAPGIAEVHKVLDDVRESTNGEILVVH